MPNNFDSKFPQHAQRPVGQSYPYVLTTSSDFDQFIAQNKTTIIFFSEENADFTDLSLENDRSNPNYHIESWYNIQAARYPKICFGRLDLDSNTSVKKLFRIKNSPSFRLYRNGQLIGAVDGMFKAGIAGLLDMEEEKVVEIAVLKRHNLNRLLAEDEVERRAEEENCSSNMSGCFNQQTRVLSKIGEKMSGSMKRKPGRGAMKG